MKAIPTKGLYKDEEIDITHRIKGTNVYKAKRFIFDTTINCYVHLSELHGFDRIRCRQSFVSRVRSKTYVKLWFFFSDLETLFISAKGWIKNIVSKWNF